MDIISALIIRDKGRSEKTRRQNLLPVHSSHTGLPSATAHRCLLQSSSLDSRDKRSCCVCSFAFFPFKNNLWFVCFYTIQISWQEMRHGSHTITPGD